MPSRVHYACFRGCPDVAVALDELVYRCPRCGGLLDVVHDVDTLRRRSPSDWRRLFDERAAGAARAGASGVWRWQEWVLPELEASDRVSLAEGSTPLLEAGSYGEELGVDDLWLKLCGSSHTGSFKDLGMTVLVSQVRAMRRRGRRIDAVGCASTGDTSASLAAYAARGAIPALVFLPADRVSMAQLLQPLAHHALVLSLDTDFDGCMQLVRAVVDRLPVYLANSLNSVRLEGQKTVAFELVQQLGWEVPDWVVLPGGNLGNLYALYKGFELMRELGVTDRLPRLACAQAERADPLYRAWHAGSRTSASDAGEGEEDWRGRYAPVRAGDTRATAIRIGDPVSVERAMHALDATDGVVEEATEDELMNEAARADRAGFFACPHTGTALAALRRLREAGTIGPSERVVTISTAHGLKFADTKIAYHAGRTGGGEGRVGGDDVQARWANRPVELPADEESVVRTLVDRLGLA